MRLSLAFFVVVALTIEKSSQDIYSDENHDGKCTILASDDYDTTLKVNNENNNPKGTNISGKLLSNGSSDCYCKRVSIMPQLISCIGIFPSQVEPKYSFSLLVCIIMKESA